MLGTNAKELTVAGPAVDAGTVRVMSDMDTRLDGHT
jgi:hypothetical protein